MTQKISAQALAQCAKACLGTPFYHQGRAAGIGLDCIGLVVHVMRHAGLEIADQTDYGREPDGCKLHAALLQHGFMEVEQVQPADILLFRFKGEPQHVGIAISHDMMVHAYAPIGRVVETRLGETWQRRMVGIYRHSMILQD